MILFFSKAGRTLVQYIIDSDKMKHNIKIELLKYIQRVDKQLIHEPSGVYGSPPLFRCYKFKLVKIIKALNVPFQELLERRLNFEVLLIALIHLF